MFELDNAIILYLQSHLSDGVMKFLEIITEFGDEMAIVAVLGLFYWCLDRKFGLRLYMNLAIANIFYPMLKNVVKRMRPYMANSEIRCLQSKFAGDLSDINTQGYSFPSGHMTNSTVIYGPIIGKYKNIILRVALVILMALVGISRFALGVHYPTDVLAGLIFGLLILFLTNKMINKFGEKKAYVAIAVIAALGFIFCRSNDYYTGYGLFLGGLPIVLMEGKFQFENTKSIPENILRMIGGAIVFLGLSELMKLPFSEEFLDSRTMGQYVFRTFRYAVCGFIALGLYPKLFKYIHFGKKN